MSESLRVAPAAAGWTIALPEIPLTFHAIKLVDEPYASNYWAKVNGRCSCTFLVTLNINRDARNSNYLDAARFTLHPTLMLLTSH